jgi:hypothetical protein
MSSSKNFVVVSKDKYTDGGVWEKAQREIPSLTLKASAKPPSLSGAPSNEKAPESPPKPWRRSKAPTSW